MRVVFIFLAGMLTGCIIEWISWMRAARKNGWIKRK